MNTTNLPANILSANTDTHQDGTRKFEPREISPEYMLMLSSVLVNESSPPHVRATAGQSLKNILSALDTAGQIECSNMWLTSNTDLKNKIKQNALLALRLSQPLRDDNCPSPQVVAAIAAIELPHNQWPDLIELLLSFINNQDNTNLKVTALQAIGFICGEINPETLSLHLNEISTTIIRCLRKEEQSPAVQFVALQVIFNSLELFQESFEHEGKRNGIMQDICEATKNPSAPIQVCAFECLSRIVHHHYDKVALYMERALPDLTVTGLKHSDECVVLVVMVFWTTICDKEIELAVKAQEALECDEQPKKGPRNLAKVALPEVVPVLLQLLVNEEEGEHDAGCNISHGAAECLSRLALAVTDTVVPAVVTFIETHIKNEDWCYRRAAVMAFNSVLGGPDTSVLTPLVIRILPLLISMMSDGNVFVKCAILQALGCIRGSLIMPDVHLHPLISALVNGLTGPPRIIASCCYALKHLAEQLGRGYDNEDGGEGQSGPMSPYYQGVVKALLRITESESKYRRTACQGTMAYYEAVDRYLASYEATNIFLRQATVDVLPVVSNTLLTVLTRMEHLLSIYTQLVDTEDRQGWNELARIPCGTITSAIHKLGGDIQPLANRIMTISIGLLSVSSKTLEVVEDTFTVIGALALELDDQFAPYIPALQPYLYPALKAHKNTQLCKSAVGLVGDLSSALSEQGTQYTGPFMAVLLENLQSEVVDESVKISILLCLRNVAWAVGPQFEPYFETTMRVLRQAEQVERASQLREGMLEAYTGIVNGFKRSEKANLLLDHVAFILDFIRRCLKDEDRTDATMRLSYSLIGNLAGTFRQGQIKSLLLSPWIANELQTEYGMPRTIRGAREMVELATQ